VSGPTTSIAIGVLSGELTLKDPTQLTAPRLLAQIGQIELSRRIEQSNMYSTDFTDVNGVKL
jgi:hypothetical protein